MAPTFSFWKKVLEFLEAIENERDVNGLFRTTLQGLEAIVPFDHAAAVATTHGSLIDPERFVVRHLDGSIVDAYMQYYWKLDPVLPRIPVLPGVTRFSWTGFRKTEFISDYIKPLGLRHTIGCTDLRSAVVPGFWVALHKGGSDVYSDTDAAFLGAVSPHIHNILLLLTSHSPDVARDCFELQKATRFSLTPAEKRIAGLLYRRLSNREIADMLYISPRTVEKHIENIFGKVGINRRRYIRNLLG